MKPQYDFPPELVFQLALQGLSDPTQEETVSEELSEEELLLELE